MQDVLERIERTCDSLRGDIQGLRDDMHRDSLKVENRLSVLETKVEGRARFGGALWGTISALFVALVSYFIKENP